jgi:Tfp pilus assembly protein PilO
MDHSQARRVMFKVSELARKANLRIGRSQMKVSQDRDSSLGKLTNDQTLSGQYRDIRQFIYDLETAPEFLVLENVAMSSQGAEGGSGALRLDVRVATYFRAGGQ